MIIEQVALYQHQVLILKHHAMSFYLVQKPIVEYKLQNEMINIFYLHLKQYVYTYIVNGQRIFHSYIVGVDCLTIIRAIEIDLLIKAVRVFQLCISLLLLTVHIANCPH